MALSPLLLGKKCFKLFLRGSPCPVRLPGRTVVKNPLANAGDVADSGSIPGSGRSPGEGHGNPVQCSWLGNPRDRGTWTVHGVERVGHDRGAEPMHTCPSLSGNIAGWMQLGEEGATEKCLLFLLCVGQRGQGASYIRSGGETHQVSLLKYPVSTKED